MAALGLHCGAQAFSSWSEQGPTHGLVALQHVESSWTRDWTHFPCAGRQVLNHWTTREVLLCLIFKLVCFSCFWVVWVLYIFWILIPYQVHCLRIFFSPSEECLLFSSFRSSSQERLLNSYFVPCIVSAGSVVKNPPADAGGTGLIPGSERSPGEGNGNPLQHSCLGNPMDRGAWRATVCGVAESDKTNWLNSSASCRDAVSSSPHC